MLARLRDDKRGTAAIEFAAAASLLAFSVLNVVDIGLYIYARMQTENAAQAGAQAAWKACNDPSMLPATKTGCDPAGAGKDYLTPAITAAIQSTGLGTKVSLAAGYPAEAYYCPTASNTLQEVGTLSSRPADCSAAGNANATPGDYIKIGVTYSYSPLFPGISVMGTSGITSITQTSWMRLG